MKPESVQPKPSDTSNAGAPAANTAQAHNPAVPPGVADLAPADPLEYLEPGEMDRPLSLTFVMFLCVFFSWGGFYIQRYSAGYDALGYDEHSTGPGSAKTNLVRTVDPYVLGKRLFADTCAKCHQPDGQGVPGQYPPLAGSEWVLAAGPARMVRIVLDAVQGPITVKGGQYNNNMTPWRDALTDQQIAAVVTYVRTQKDWGHTASPVTPDQISNIRNQTKDRPAIGPWTASELLAVADHEPQHEDEMRR